MTTFQQRLVMVIGFAWIILACLVSLATGAFVFMIYMNSFVHACLMAIGGASIAWIVMRGLSYITVRPLIWLVCGVY